MHAAEVAWINPVGQYAALVLTSREIKALIGKDWAGTSEETTEITKAIAAHSDRPAWFDDVMTVLVREDSMTFVGPRINDGFSAAYEAMRCS